MSIGRITTKLVVNRDASRVLALWTIYCEEPCVVIWCFGASNQEVIDSILGLFCWNVYH